MPWRELACCLGRWYLVSKDLEGVEVGTALGGLKSNGSGLVVILLAGGC